MLSIKGSNNPMESIPAVCDWYNNFNVAPSNLECVLTYCVNGSAIPTLFNYATVKVNSTSSGYNVVAQDRINLGDFLKYGCNSSFYIQNDTNLISEASSSINVYCENGLFKYPEHWPICVDNIQCVDPGSTQELNRTEIFLTNYTYTSKLEYKCKDLRSYVRTPDPTIPVAPSVVSTCQWRKTFSIDGSTLKCVIHHCGHPNSGNGSHTAPPIENNIKLVSKTIITTI